MNILTHRFTTITSILIIISIAVYTICWFSLAYILKDKTTHLISQINNQNNIKINAQNIDFTGFPLKPAILFSGQIMTQDGNSLTSDNIKISGFPFPSQNIIFEIPQNAEIILSNWPKPITIKHAIIDFNLPPFSMINVTHETIVNWQQTGGNIPINDLKIESDVLDVNGKGFVELDQNLQPSGMIAIHIKGLSDLIEQGVANDKIDPRQAIMAQSLLQLVSQTDPQTRETIIATSLRAHKNGLFLGPLRFYTIPTVEWRW